ncbi:Predicted unsaturated glucuronyl hydrolase involved in regulation of bacterial surface properties, and related proteins [Leclercia adecarboxylata]|uniref:Predicted unsaturated glucuronyl hydrolase involved in regulation of bacterial surface properties, and related proteins n=1 Tax=Leclercia adecarboxylata TaxID=83655 RepID=A0A4U9I0T4_9ENTR|nr:Predicted unsaturated glucuronyl hydrolase involved in regulation of bacterial surface properties, and related proteins [Leclercia adecarboxylata]
MKVWPVKHSPLLRQPERFIARDELKALIQKVTHNLVNIHDKTGEFLLRLDDGRVIDTKGWAGWEWTPWGRSLRYLAVLLPDRG